MISKYYECSKCHYIEKESDSVEVNEKKKVRIMCELCATKHIKKHNKEVWERG